MKSTSAKKNKKDASIKWIPLDDEHNWIEDEDLEEKIRKEIQKHNL